MRRFILLAGLAKALPLRPRPVIAPDLLEDAGNTLAELIDVARQQAIADGVRPVPATVHRALLGYFPSALLQRCRFATGRARAITVPRLGLSYGDATAVTLGDVVLFKSERLAESALKLWAHELTHVMQYQRWGIAGFADRYVRDSGEVEQEAIGNADRFAAWLPRQVVRSCVGTGWSFRAR